MLVNKYYPKLQKDFFHKENLLQIKKWINDNLINNETEDYKKILCILGPIGCGKTVTINYLFSNYELIKLDSDTLRTNEKTNDILKSLVHFKSKTISDINKWDNKNYKQKFNILFIDNIELCDKSMSSFINLLYNEFKINIPLILIGNNQKSHDIFNDREHDINIIKFLKPCNSEITRLLNKISISEGIKFSKFITNKIILKSENDIRQLFYILDQLFITLKTKANELHDDDINDLLDKMDSKITDLDLFEKMYILMVNDICLEKRFNICSSEPQTISCSVYQNYINYIDNIENISNVIDSISNSNIINSCIYDDQNWELYDNYTFTSSVIPSLILNKNCNLQKNKTIELNTFKDISYNFSNSLNDVINICRTNNYSVVFQSVNKNDNTFSNDVLGNYIIIKWIIYNIEIINNFFDSKKKGKNTTKKEKFEICDLLPHDKKKHLINIVNFIYSYKIFETDINDILLNKKEYLIKEKLQRDVDKIDIRIFKRLLNIFTFDNGNKILKSHTETAIKYYVFAQIIDDINKNYVITQEQDKINYLIQDIETIWKI